MKRNQKGFTLMEMLIVVAIIAILIAVSIPIFTSQLEKAREATDSANERAAKAVAVTRYLSEDIEFGSATEIVFYYDAISGTLKDDKTGITGYGKGTTAKDDLEDHTDMLIEVTITAADGTVKTDWKATTTP